MEVEVEQRGRFAAILRQDPSAGNRGHCRADAAATADERNHLAQSALGAHRAAFFQCRGERLPAYRLDDIVGRAGRQQIAEQRDIIDHTESNDLKVAAADRTSRAELGDRRVGITEIENEDARLVPFTNAPQGRIECGFEAQLVFEVQLTDDALHPLEGWLILQDRHDTFALGLLGNDRFFTDCGDCTHY